MNIYIYIHTPKHICVNDSMRIHTYIHTCIHTYMHTYIHAYMHTYIHMINIKEQPKHTSRFTMLPG